MRFHVTHLGNNVPDIYRLTQVDVQHCQFGLPYGCNDCFDDLYNGYDEFIIRGDWLIWVRGEVDTKSAVCIHLADITAFIFTARIMLLTQYVSKASLFITI